MLEYLTLHSEETQSSSWIEEMIMPLKMIQKQSLQLQKTAGYYVFGSHY